MNSLSQSPSQDHFRAIREKMDTVLSSSHGGERIEATLGELSDLAQELDRVWLSISGEMNVHSVNRAQIIGEICNHVKDHLLHGEWTTWAEQNFTEHVRTLQKFMVIARSKAAVRQYARLGTEKLYQLSRISHLLTEGSTFEDLFTHCGLNVAFERATCKEFERDVNFILNRQTMDDLDIHLSIRSLQVLTESFSLIGKNQSLVTRLAQGRYEGADVEKTVENIVASGPGGRSYSKTKGTTRPKEDINSLVERFIRRLQEVMDDPAEAEDVDENRLRFVAQLIEEYFAQKTSIQ